jgi:adenosine deaminase
MSPLLETSIRSMPKVELHVHLEGAIQPETLLELARRNRVVLPATTIEELHEWYRFTSFSHFVNVYLTISDCIRTPEDIEMVAREFLAGQAAQHIVYSEVTYTAYTHAHFKGIPYREQLAALARARAWAETTLSTSMGIILDIPRSISSEEGLQIAKQAIRGMSDGVVALGLAGAEADNPPAKFKNSFDLANAAGLPSIPHAGEMSGAESIWGAIQMLHAVRIGHGVRCLEDPSLVAILRTRQIPLEVCPTSNVCLGVVPGLSAHPLPHLQKAGLYVTLNSDDPALFNTTLTDEYLAVAQTFGMDDEAIAGLALNAIRAALLPDAARARIEAEFHIWRSRFL